MADTDNKQVNKSIKFSSVISSNKCSEKEKKKTTELY